MVQTAYSYPASVPFYATRPSILIAEDDEDIAAGLEVMLHCAYNVRVEPSARDALQTLEIEAPDLLLLDYQLPDMNGLRLLDAIRRRWDGAPPAVMLSAFPSRREACLSAGMSSFLEKPCTPSDLVWAIEKALREARSV